MGDFQKLLSLNRATVFLGLVSLGLVILAGCAHTAHVPSTPLAEEVVGLTAAYESEVAAAVAPHADIAQTPEPRHVQSTHATEYWDVTLDEVVRMALQNSQVLRDLGGRIVTQSGNVSTFYNPEVVGSDARTGVDAALSAFDAQLNSSILWRRNNRGLKQPPPGVTNIEIDQLTHQQRSSISKLMRTGTRLEVQQGLDYDKDDLGIPPNRFASAYTPFVGAEIRHPLARGGGRKYNEIAGPNAGPGVYNGIVIATLKTEIAETDFQIALRDYLFNVVRNYWFLKFAYERVVALESNLEVSRKLLAAAEEKSATGIADIDTINAARERFLNAELALQSALAGGPERQLFGILGTSGGLLSGNELGALAVERRLRFLIGLPASDGRLLRPVDGPSEAPLIFDWQEALSTALQHRPELARQQKVVRQRRLELLASRNQLLPTVDLIGQYRVLGFGDHLSGNSLIPQDGALDELSQAELQEWAAGLEFRWPVGNRIGHTAQRNALLVLAREEEVYRQQQLQISHEIASAVSELKRAQSALHLSRQRRQVAFERWDAAKRKLDEGYPIPIEVVLEAQARDADASTGLAVAVADYAIAVSLYNVAKGSLLKELAVCVTTEVPFAVTEGIGAMINEPLNTVPQASETMAEARTANAILQAPTVLDPSNTNTLR